MATTPKLTLTKFHELSKDYSLNSDGELDVTKYHSIKISETFNQTSKKANDGKPVSALNYLTVFIEDKSTGSKYPAKFKISLSDRVVSGGVKPPAERDALLKDADPTCNFSSKDNPVFFEALNNYYIQVEGILNHMKKTGKFIEKSDKKGAAANPSAMKVDNLKISKSPITTHTKDDVKIDNPFIRYGFKRTKDDKSKFANPIRDSRTPITVNGKFVNYDHFKVNGVVVNVSNIHEAVNPGTIHLGEFDMSNISCSGMGISHRASFVNNAHIIVYAPKVDRSDISNLIDQSEAEELAKLSAGTATMAVTVTEVHEDDGEGGGDGEGDEESINLDLGE